MLKTALVLGIVFLSYHLQSQSLIESIPPCPSSPNCVSTTHKKASRQLSPLPYSTSLHEAKTQLKTILKTMKNAKFVLQDDFSIHYEFTTKVGKFTDDVHFYFDTKNKEIHFRSASRKGYHDMGANKRRMKKITKAWNKKG